MSPRNHDRGMPRQVALLLGTALALFFAASCAAPAKLAHHRSVLLYPELKPFVPEGRIRHIPEEKEEFTPLGGEEGTEEVQTGRPETEGGVGAEENLSKVAEKSAPQEKPRLLVSPLKANGESIAQSARDRVNAPTVNYSGQKKFNEDCSGFVRSVYWNQGIDLFAGGTRRDDNGVTAIYRFISARGGIHVGYPQLGDLVFFKNTADTNRDGRWNDGLTHIGIVESIREDGTVMVVHRASKGIVHQAMNLAFPEKKKGESGQVINDYLRGAPSPQLMGQLFYRFGTVLAPAQPSSLSQAVKSASASLEAK